VISAARFTRGLGPMLSCSSAVTRARLGHRPDERAALRQRVRVMIHGSGMGKSSPDLPVPVPWIKAESARPRTGMLGRPS